MSIYSSVYFSVLVVVGVVLTLQWSSSPTLQHKCMQGQVWLSGSHKPSYVFVFVMITDDL